ncbi:MAG: hypothetical protein JNL97_07575, partial [Verrucomicrobiales bacterium]|nr:hypothetical protein [Verrucomicrobiales bacterium]
LLVYAVEHFNWGPRGSVRFVEFRHEQVYREGNPIYGIQPALVAPELVFEDSSATLDAGASKRIGSVRPWVEIFEDANYNGRSVIMDWLDRDKEDFKDLRKLSWPDGFNDKASSVRWFAPLGWKIRLYDGDNYKVNDDEPYLDLPGLGYQNGIRVLSESPYEMDNQWYDGVLHETRVTSMKFIPPGEPPDLLDVPAPWEDEPETETEADDGWSKPKEHLTYRWRLLGPDLEPYPTSSATLTAVPGSPWLATLRTFTRQSESLNVELTVGPLFEKKIVRPIRFLKRNRTPTIVSTSQSVAGGRVELAVTVKDDDASDDLRIYAKWGNLPERIETEGRDGQRTFVIDHVFSNPDPDQILRSDVVVVLRAEDSNTASSPLFEEHVRIVWRANAAPRVTPETFERAVTSGFKTRIRTLVANDSDPDGDFFEFAGIRGVFPDGATVTEQDGWLLYTPPPGGGHLPGGFDYALRDQFKAIGTGRVGIVPQSGPAGASLNLVSVRPRDGGGVEIEFQGLPGRVYTVDAATFPAGPWSRLGQSTTDSVGRLRIEDPRAGAQRFYKTQLLVP